MQGEYRQLFIDGQLCDADSGETFDDINPANGETIARIALAGESDVDRAVGGRPGPARMGPLDRRRTRARAAPRRRALA